jgi:hypothetical protein
MNPRQQNVRRIAAAGDVDLLVYVSLLRKAVVTPPSVGANLCARLNRRRNKRDEAGTLYVVDTLQGYSTKPLWRQDFDGNHHNELGVRAATANAVLNTAYIGFIDLDRAMKSVSPRPHHGRAQLL